MEIDSAGLRTLAAVVAAGTFDAAAHELHLTPSAVSQRIKALETAVGRVVLQRGKPARPTADGEVLLRLAKQWDWLHAEATSALTGGVTAGESDTDWVEPIHMPIAANADSLTIWLMPAIVAMSRSHNVVIEVMRGDETRTADFLRSGSVLGAVTSDPTRIRGCTAVPLGAMRYLPVATPEFAARWFPSLGASDARSPSPAELSRAPMVSFDRSDAIQRTLIEDMVGRTASPPTSYIPSSTQYHLAVEAGIGWGAVPAMQASQALDAGRVVRLSDQHRDVELYWQHWRLHSPLLETFTALVRYTAAEVLLSSSIG
ncbi:LysR family transcriptional regulator ArgP [Gordonia jinhuaensis]|uniref:Transcriptional regulator ArgP n=1 Tax=Gordonia jinhuaensis TaxID=1517702 RepID=A0A916TGU1_9ACTN|nr:LysR family transcriptional regulator ArgP [Gordonia jinhuaensis]GGB44864.1 transcriptional regulator ArgP [Gordonia jinhuaensis]